MKNAITFVQSFLKLYSQKRIARASAALSYFLTMTFFPLVICLYTMLGDSYEKAMRVMEFAKSFIAPDTVQYIQDFLTYVARNNSSAMMVAGLAVLVTSASAAERTVHATIGELQGGPRFRGVYDFIFSIVFSIAFLATIYFAIIVMLTGKDLLAAINNAIPVIDISYSWVWIRFIILFAIALVIIWGVYEVSKRRTDNYETFAGAIFASIAVVVFSIVFSAIIGSSVKYHLVYGSIVSIILLMVWLYTCCIVIYCGAVLNIVIRDSRDDGQNSKNIRE